MAPPRKKAALEPTAKEGEKEPERKVSQSRVEKQPAKAPRKGGAGRAKKFKLSIDDFRPKHRAKFILTCGEGDQIGHGERLTTKKPRRIDGLPADAVFTQVAAGGVHTLALAEDGRVFSCGVNEKGTVPTESAEAEGSVNELAPIVLPEDFEAKYGKIVMVSAGASFSAAVTEKGDVVAWGNLRDINGTMETHDMLMAMQKGVTVIVPHQMHRCVKVACGENHLIALGEDGSIVTFGDGSQGQLGRLAVCRNHRIQYMVKQSLKCMVIERGKEVKFADVWAGGYWSMARASDGRVFAFGLNSYGQLGVSSSGAVGEAAAGNDAAAGDDAAMDVGDDTKELRVQFPTVADRLPSDIHWTHAAGQHHVILRADDGRVFGIGKNTDNALGLGTWSRQDGREENWKYLDVQRLTNLPEDVRGITASLGCSLAWTQNGRAFSWGNDTVGQLGLGITDDDDEKLVETPRLITSAHLDNCQIVQASMADNHSVFLVAANE
uniref:Regulator of chromosome condensation n=1 Tax=Plectus sambesii TaxID=2011161 RepID=A0A914X2N2_9BILA